MPPDLVLVDSSAWIHCLRKNSVESIREKVGDLLEKNLVAIMPMIELELLGGTKSRPEFDRLKTRLDALIILELTEEIWYESAQLAFDLRREGLTLPYTDILIGQTAISYRASILHADSHFDIIAEKEPSLSAENCSNLL